MCHATYKSGIKQFCWYITLWKDSGTGGIAVVNIELLGEALLLRFAALLCVELKNPF